MTRATLLFRLYQAGTALALPFAARRAIAKVRAAGFPALRAHERLGNATAERRLGPLIWCHAASVGEVKSVLPVLHHIAQSHPEVHLLLTSGTATSAQVVEGDLPPGAVHQFAPLDAAGPLDRFLRHWRPSVCVLVESELWPNLLDRCARARIPVALLNARLSDKSARGWQKFPATTAYVTRAIAYAHCQDRRTRDHLRAMGLRMAALGDNLKSLTSAPQVSAEARDAGFAALGGRPVWVAASTHPGEEEQVLAAHKTLLRQHPHLCLILAPRHPERGDAVAQLIKDQGLSVAQRSAGGALEEGAQVYLADTLGEMGLWYSLSPIVFLGGSFSQAGGHTPFEPAAAHSAILHGPHYANFQDVYAAFHMAEASVEVQGSAALAQEVETLLTHPNRAAMLAANARPLAKDGAETLPPLVAALCALVEDAP